MPIVFHGPEQRAQGVAAAAGRFQVAIDDLGGARVRRQLLGVAAGLLLHFITLTQVLIVPLEDGLTLGCGLYDRP